MKTEEYTKHKDCSPEETVFRIRRILQEADLYPVLTWTEDEFDGVCSNRVFLDPVMGLGTNGKGTGRRYAEASAFAELIERIQNRILHIKAFGPEESPYPISDRYPDEKDMRLEELVAQKDAFTGRTEDTWHAWPNTQGFSAPGPTGKMPFRRLPFSSAGRPQRE